MSANADLYRQLEDLKSRDVKKMTYAEYLRWYADMKELQNHFSLPVIPLDMFQSVYEPPRSSPQPPRAQQHN